MSVSITRNEVVHLDGYNYDPTKEVFKPLLVQLSEDLLANGFVDVGPQITKLVITEEELTKFIDEFIVWHYDSSTQTQSAGAFGVDNPISLTASPTYTDFKLDGEYSRRIKAIEDLYNDPDWHDEISTVISKPNSYSGSLDFTKLLGPNAELFSYLNPHPSLRGGSPVWKTTVFSKSAVTSDTVVHFYNTAQLSVGETLLEINGAAVSSGPTIVSINSGTQVTLSSAQTLAVDDVVKFGDPAATLDRPSDQPNGHFLKKKPTPTKLQTKSGSNPQPGYVGLPSLSQKVYENEYNKVLALLTKVGRGVSFLPAAESGVNTKAELRHYKRDVQPDGSVKHAFWISNLKDQFFFPSGTVEPSKYKGELLIGFDQAFTENNFQVGDIYTFSFVHSSVSPAPNVTYQVPVTVGDDSSVDGFTRTVLDELVKTNIADPKGGLFEVTLDPDRVGVLEFESREIGHNLTCTVTRTERPTTSYSNTPTLFTVPQTTASSTVTDGSTEITGDTYTNGYVHEVQIRGLDGSNIADTFEITLTGVIDEAAADKLTNAAAVKNVTVSYTSPKNLNAAQLSENIANALRGNSYINSYMTVVAGSNYISLKYNRNSSAYMKISDTSKTHGFLGTDSSSFTGTSVTIGDTTSAEYGLNGFLVADLPARAAFVVDVSNFYTEDVLIDASNAGVADPLDLELAQLQLGVTTDVSSVRLQFPLSRDLGTFANPVNGTWSVFTGLDEGNATSYFVSYYQQVVSADDRPLGPQVSFDQDAAQDHPNTTHGLANRGLTHWSEFATFSKELKIESFEYVTDRSMGPLVFETDRTLPISGNNGDQPWRVRFNVSRGIEVNETSPYINTTHLQLSSSSGDSAIATNNFEYLNVHVATEFQLNSDGNIAQVEGRDGIRSGNLREPGFLGGIRTQFNGYQESVTHLINPFVNRSELDSQLKSGFNIRAGRVGEAHYDSAGSTKTGLSAAFTNSATITNPTIPVNVTLTNGILLDNEYRYEESFLSGTSTELVADTPFNDGKLRMQKGWFRRTGKTNPAVASQYPMAYTITIADHGMAMYLKDQASTNQSDDNAFFVVQRHVDATTGAPDFTSDQQPIHCLYQSSESPILFSDFTPYFNSKTTERTASLAYQGVYDISGNYLTEFKIDELKDEELQAMNLDIQGRFRRFVVREKDVLKPWDRHVFAGINEVDSHAVLNPLEQLSLNDAGQLVIQFPNRLGTQRFLYTGTELDLVSFCAAGAVGQDTLISSDRFSSTGTNDKRRIYKGMMSTQANGNGMRILQLVGGNGINTTDVDTSLLTS